MIEIYTGDGKGKTTAAVGLAVRAKSRGLKVLFAQFMKSDSGGETELLASLGIAIRRFPEVASPLFHPELEIADLRRKAKHAMEQIAPVLGAYDLVILDEFINVCRRLELGEDDVKTFLDARPPQVELVLTGRDAPEYLIECADLVTEMRAVRHFFEKGVKARRGIEF